jgi:hypothetical protein
MDEETSLLCFDVLRRAGERAVASRSWAEAQGLARGAWLIASRLAEDGYLDFARVRLDARPEGRLDGVAFDVGTNLVAAGDTLLVPEWDPDPDLLIHYRRRIFAHDGHEGVAFVPRRTTATAFDVIDISHVWHNNWFHFLIEICGLLADPEHARSPAKVIVNYAATTGPQGEALATLAPAFAERLVPVVDFARIGCRSLHRPRGIWQPAHYHRDPARPTHLAARVTDPAAAQAFYRRAWPDRRPEGRRLVIVRPATSRRRAANEAQVTEAFVARGFEVVEPGALPFRVQAELFHDADVIVGMSGAAFANIVFCRPGTRVVCARSAESGSVTYERLAAGFDLDFRLIDGEVVERAVERDHSVFAVDPQVLIDAALGP